MSILARLGVVLALDSAQYKAGLDDATKNLKQFEANQKKAAKAAQAASADMLATAGRVGGAIAAIVAAIGAIAKKADDISDMADAFDASIGSIIGLSKAMDQAGGKGENLGTVLTKLSVNAQNAKEGSDQLRDSFRSIGITAGEVENLKPDELFERVGRQLAKIEDPTTRSAKAMELLGKSAKNIDWSKFVDEYQKVADPDLARAVKDAADAWDDVQKGLSKTFYFAVKLVQPLIAIVRYLDEIGERYKEFKEQGGAINFDTNNPMGEGIDFTGTGAAAKPKPKPDEGPKFKSDTYKTGTPKEAAAAAERARIQASYEAKLKELELINIQIQREGELIGLNQQDQEMKKLAWKYEDDAAKSWLAFQAQINEEKAKGAMADEKKLELLEKQQILFQLASEAELENARISEEANIQKIRDRQLLTDEEKAGFDQFVGNLAEMGKQNKAAFVAWKAMATAQTIISTYEGAQNAFTSLSKIPYVGPALGIAAAAAAIGAGMMRVQSIMATQYQGRAKGGSVMGGNPYLVGENGPEIVVPHRGGTVIPNNRLSSSLGQQPQNVYNGPYIENMSAIDTQSAMQFLSKNKNSVWAANQSASRGMPASRS